MCQGVKKMYEGHLHVHERIPPGFLPAHEPVMPAEHKPRLGREGKGEVRNSCRRKRTRHARRTGFIRGSVSGLCFLDFLEIFQEIFLEIFPEIFPRFFPFLFRERISFFLRVFVAPVASGHIRNINVRFPRENLRGTFLRVFPVFLSRKFSEVSPRKTHGNL